MPEEEEGRRNEKGVRFADEGKGTVIYIETRGSKMKREGIDERKISSDV